MEPAVNLSPGVPLILRAGFASGTAHCSYSHLMTPGYLAYRWVIGIARRNLIQMDEIFTQSQ